MPKTIRSAQQRASQSNPLAKVSTTLGELIVAAYDTVGNKFDVAQLLTSRTLSRATHARIVLQ